MSRSKDNLTPEEYWEKTKLKKFADSCKLGGIDLESNKWSEDKLLQQALKNSNFSSNHQVNDDIAKENAKLSLEELLDKYRKGGNHDEQD